jgi:predicted RND superfamily exporter protein
VILSSCSLEKRIERRLRRAERKIEKLTIKYPSILKKDTLHDTIEVYTPLVQYDTSFIDTNRDTIFINKDRLSIKYIRVGDTTFIQGECKSDTIIKTIKVPYEKVVVRKQGIIEQLGKNLKRILLIGFMLLIVLIALYVIFKLLIKSIFPLRLP